MRIILSKINLTVSFRKQLSALGRKFPTLKAGQLRG
jgi:hypothetical protein